MPLFMSFLISHYCLLDLFICVFLFSYFLSFYLFILLSHLFIYSYVRVFFPCFPPLLSFLPSTYFYFFHSSFLSLFYFFSSIYFSSLVVNAFAAVYFRHFISKIRSETSLLNLCSFHVCQFEFA